MRGLIPNIFGISALGALCFIAGYQTGQLLLVREELRVNLPMYVRMYQDLSTGRLDRATNYLGIYVIEQVRKFDEIEKNVLLRVVGTKSLFNSTSFQACLLEARGIAARQATNMTWIGPTKKF